MSKLLCASMCLFAGAALAAGNAVNTATWKPIFNGKDLGGWSGTPQPFAYIITDADFKDYVISLEYRWGEKKFPPRLHEVRDAGLLYHVYRVRPSEWPASAEAQIQEGDTGDSWAISTQASSFVDPKTGRYALPESGGVPITGGTNEGYYRTRHGRVNERPGWNTLEVIVRGDRATHVVNGVVNMRVSELKSWDTGTNSWVKLDHGKIVLQAEGAEVFYRNIKVGALTETDDMPPAPALTEVWFPVPAKVTRHHLRRAALRGGRFAHFTGATHRVVEWRAGAEQLRAQGRHHPHRHAQLSGTCRNAAAPAGSWASGPVPQHLGA